MNLYPLSEIIEIATKRGIFLGKGTPQNRIAYFVKTGLIPHAIRKTNPRTEKIEAHFPLSILETIEEINHLKRKNYSPYQIKASLVPQARDFSADQVQEEINIPRFSYRIHNPRVLVAAFAVLLIAVLYSNFLLSLVPSARPQGSAVLGMETFIAPVVQEVSPIFSPVARFVSSLGNSVRLGIGTFLLSLLPLDFQTKTGGEGSSTTNNTTTLIQSGDIPSDLVLSSLTVDNNGTIGGNLLVTGTINTNTFTGSKLVFSGISPSIYPSTTNTSISLNASGTGAINIGNSGTGDVYIAGGSGDGGCTITNSSGSLNCSSNITSAGDLIVNGGDILTDLSTLTLGTSSQTVRIPGTLTITKAPTLPHTGTWSIGASTWNVSDSSFYINPSTATPDSNLFGLAINGAVRFAVDAEGDTYVNNLILAGNITSATTTVSGDLTVEGNTILGDSTTDTITLNPATITWVGTAGGGTRTLDITGTGTQTLSFLNSTSSQVLDLNLSDGDLKLNGTVRISNAGVGTFDDIAVNGGDITTSASTVNIVNSATTVNLGSTNVTRTTNIGTGTNADTINIGTGGTTGDTINIGGISGTTINITGGTVNVTGNVVSTGTVQGTQLISTVATGTAPLTVASTTMVTNLNANYLGGQAAADLGYSTNPNLVLNSDFSRRNKWMTFMPEVFSDTSGWTAVIGSLGSVSGNQLTPTPSSSDWSASAGIPWRDGRISALFQAKGNAANDTFAVGFYVDANNWIRAQVDVNIGRIYITENVGGSQLNIASQAGADTGQLTVNNYYWLELERQGTKIIDKWYSCGASAVAKSSCTLQYTLSATTSLPATSAGYANLRTYNPGTTHKIGGLSTGDGGVYVEGWGPESWTATFSGTKGGQAFGFDEAADSGPIEKQWAIKAYIPVTSRQISLTNTGPDGGGIASQTYALSGYVKTSGTSGSGGFQFQGNFLNSAETDQGGPVVLADSSQASWTRLSGTATSPSGTRRLKAQVLFNPNGNVSGTYWAQLVQFEQGSTVTPWRNAPADDGPITWELHSTIGNVTVAGNNNPGTEIDARDLAANIFLPWDGSLSLEFQTKWTNSASTGAGIYAIQLDAANIYSQPALYYFVPEAVNTKTAHLKGIKSTTAGKHRIRALHNTDGGVTLTTKCDSGTNYDQVPCLMWITATRGKFDLAEEYSVLDQTIEGGDVIRLSSLGGTTVEKVSGGYQQDILGIISTDPGITLSSQVELNGYREKPNLRPVALQGRVPVKVTSENGVIRRGDILTSSNTKPGYAMKATKAGRSIGIAMEDMFEPEGKIMTFVNLSFYDPDVYLASTGELVIAKQTKQSVLTSATDTEDNKLVDGLYKLENTRTKEVIERTGAFNDLFVANLKVGRLDASEITELIKLEQRIKNLELATTSAVLSASISGLLNDEEASTSGVLTSLTVQGRTILNDLGVTGIITSGTLSIDGLQNTISSLADLKFQLPGGEVTIDTSGNLKVHKVQTEELVVTSSALGKGTLNVGQLSVEISSTYVKQDSRIFLTPITKTNKQILNATITGVGKFNVEIEEPQAFDINFNYLIVNAN